MTHGAFCAPDPRSLVDRFWSKLGFGCAYVPRPDDLEGFAESYMVTGTYVRLDWRDRLRILISGKAQVEILTKTDVIVRRMVSTSGFSVLPPNYPIRPQPTGHASHV